MGRWNKVPFSIELECESELNNGRLMVFDRQGDKATPVEIELPAGFTPDVLILDCESTGYDHPGSMYGGPDGVGYPPEFDDKRSVVRASLKGTSGLVIVLAHELRDQLADIFSEDVANA